jgi:hypothetical protein
MHPEAGTDRAAMAATAATVLLWASSFVVIGSAGHHFGPGALAFGRSWPDRRCSASLRWYGGRARRRGPPGLASPASACCGSASTWLPELG